MLALIAARRSSLSTEPLRAPGERPAFRADIEGLRGIAVLLVVLYHAGVPGFEGGYIGVDVFFALSGYLITGILAAEVEQTGRLDLARFYARRARRLLPAMAVLLAAVTAFAYAFYSPMEQGPIAKTALATAAYVSNFHFAAGATDYLAAEAETNPLLHTWSLSVEEQFYLGWPLLVLFGLAGLSRWRPSGGAGLSHRRLLWTMVAVAAVSFVGSLYLMGTLRVHWAFFASPARAWEFAVGGLGALLPRLRIGSFSAVRPMGAVVLGWVGLVAVLATGVLYTGTTLFPGWAAVLPVVGTVWALRAGVGSASGGTLESLLAWRPLQEAGRLSYSWYLWHWPVLVFGVGVLGDLDLPARLGLVACSLLLAEGSYRLVEDPVRHHRGIARRPANGLALMAALTAGGILLAFGWRAAAAAAAARPDQAFITSAPSDRTDGCSTDLTGTGITTCGFGDPNSSTVVVVFGDSHAGHLLPAVEQVALGKGWRVETLLKSTCGTLGAPIWSVGLGRMYEECDEWREAAFNWLKHRSPDLVVTSSYFRVYEESAEPPEWEQATARVFKSLAERSGAVLFVRDIPSPGFDVPACQSRAVWRGRSDRTCSFDHTSDQGGGVYEAQVAAARHFSNVTTADITGVVCPTTPCDTVRGDSLVVWRDDHHISNTFSRGLAPTLELAMVKALSKTDGLRGTPVTDDEMRRPPD